MQLESCSQLYANYTTVIHYGVCMRVRACVLALLRGEGMTIQYVFGHNALRAHTPSLTQLADSTVVLW